jgi:hypothetical protein
MRASDIFIGAYKSAENLFASTTTDVSAGFYFSFTSSLHALIARRRDAFGSRQ